MIGYDWSNASLAGAFVVGVTFGVFVSLRVLRAVMAMFDPLPRRPRRRPEREPSDDASGR